MADQNRILVPLLLSFTAGYVDTAGFLALQGLFTAHVTGNFVTFGASLALGTSGALAKLLALPVFCVVVIAVRIVGTLLSKYWRPVFEILLGFKIVLLIAGAALAIWLGPFHDGDSPPAVLTGMVFVSAMAIQNAVHRVYLGGAPPSTLMTGTTTQIMIDLADIVVRGSDGRPAGARSGKMALNVLLFAIGCGAAALLFIRFEMWCFVLPPIASLASLAIRLADPEVASQHI
ncbi:DUF1275 domain-containing protein [Bradyrhizobium sp. Arg68]|uniref:YoaK family protein n=1 Tax=Bradyrhizobium ivorense TaxID=2511166 RepID=UPI001E4C1796|nr:YoaK family protein [Bradyrhizobium ivorense]MCC8940314.1 DUF1275 domain-containing protein [Bradyrhizobium ivorense]